MKYVLKLTALLVIIAGISWSCKKKDDNTADPGVVESAPVIDSISATKLEIEFGGKDPTTLTAHAQGGNLTYQWEVDLGDLIPLNEEASSVSYAGSACCIGDKEIKCTVTNTKGTNSKIILIKILDP